MQFSSIDWTAIAAIWMGGIIVLVPIAGVVLRYAVAPLLFAAAEQRRQAGADSAIRDERLEDLDARLTALEVIIADGGASASVRRSA